MELASRRIRVPDERTVIKLYPLGDLHLGADACDQAAAEYVVKQIANDPWAFWIGMGDYADCIMPTDPRWTMRVLDWSRIGRDKQGRPDVADLGGSVIRLVDEFFAPIWHKCLGLLTGNHEQVFSKYYFQDLTKRLAHQHGVPYLGHTALYRLYFEGNKWTSKYDVFAEHGASGGGTDGNALNDFSKRLAQFDASIYLRGHIHKKSVYKRSELAWGLHRPRIVSRVMVLTGTYLRTLVIGELTYAEQKGYSPAEIGSMCILIRPRQGDVEAVDVCAMDLLK